MSLLLSSPAFAQKSFEGIIDYRIDVEVSGDSAAAKRKQKVEEDFGKNCRLYISQFGDFKMVYPDSGANGLQYDLYSPETGKVKRVYGNEAPKNPSKMMRLLSKNKVAPEIVIGKNCDCVQYSIESSDRKRHKVTYCYSADTPKIDYRLFKNCEYLMLQEFYEMAERPYLKYVFETGKTKIIYTATKIEVQPLELELFKS